MRQRPLWIDAVAAVTPVGLDAPQTCSAFRARISGIKRAMLRPPPAEPISAARVPARQVLRASERAWLMNLISRAAREALSRTAVPIQDIALLLSLPEPYRRHPAFDDGSPEAFVSELERDLGGTFCERTVLLGGHDATLQSLSRAEAALNQRARACLLCGVDSLLNRADVEALAEAGRLHEDNNPQGVIPGEGAAGVLVSSGGQAAPLALIAGWGEANETNTVVGDNYSTGEGLSQAITAAAASAAVAEPEIAFRVSDMNGERYRGWESFLAATRFYRTHRERLPFLLPAMSVGDIGAAASALELVVAATAISRGYAPGAIGCCESSSSQGSRAAAIVTPTPASPIPPFRSRHVP